MTDQVLLFAACLVSLLACTGVDPSARSVTLDDLEHQSESNGVWQSAEWDTPWLTFPAKQTVTIEHGLGTTPRLVQVYIDFDRAGCDRDAMTTSLLASGTLARISQVNSNSITVRNDTKEDYCVRLVAQ
jgi:hypothetical protein